MAEVINLQWFGIFLGINKYNQKVFVIRHDFKGVISILLNIVGVILPGLA